MTRKLLILGLFAGAIALAFVGLDIQVDITPGPGPSPTPTVDPIPGPGLAVLIVEETGLRAQLPLSQFSLLSSLELRQLVEDNGGEFRLLDADAELKYADPKWKHAMSLPRTSLPWWVVSNGADGFSEPLPMNLADALERLGGVL